MGGFLKRGKVRGYGDFGNFPVSGLCYWLSVAHWLVRAYGHVEVGPLLGLSGLSLGVAGGPFSVPLLRPAYLKQPLQKL